MEKNDLITTRDGVDADRNFILATWLRGLRYGNSWFEAIDQKTYFEFYQRVIETILARPDTVVKVACLKEDPEVILGYAVYAGGRLDWVFVKKAWRSIGVAKSLVPQDITVVSHLTEVGKSIMRRHPPMVFNPFALS